VKRDEIIYFIEYHNRANKKIFDTAAQLSNEQLMRTGKFDHDTAFQSLRHMVDVDWSWRQFCMGNDVGKAYLWETVPMNNLDEVRAAWEMDSAEFLAYAQQMDGATLQHEVKPPFDVPVSVPIWQVLVHVVNHGTQHRSELARYFTECGYSPGSLDML